MEYSRHGTVIKGQEKARVKSRYEEDVYINNHTVGPCSTLVLHSIDVWVCDSFWIQL